MASQAQPEEGHALPQSAASPFRPHTLGDTASHRVFYRYLRLLPFDRRRRHLVLEECTILSFARASVHFFSGPSDGLMRHSCDNIQLDHFVSEHAQGPSLMPLRSLTTTERYQMGFFISSDFSTVGIGHRFARQGSFKTFFNKTFLELLDFFGGHVIRRRNVSVCLGCLKMATEAQFCCPGFGPR